MILNVVYFFFKMTLYTPRMKLIYEFKVFIWRYQTLFYLCIEIIHTHFGHFQIFTLWETKRYYRTLSIRVPWKHNHFLKEKNEEMKNICFCVLWTEWAQILVVDEGGHCCVLNVKCSHSLICPNTWSPAGGVLWDVCGACRKCVCHHFIRPILNGKEKQAE